MKRQKVVINPLKPRKVFIEIAKGNEAYTLVGEIETHYLLFNEYTKNRFFVNKKEVFETREELNYFKFARDINHKSLKDRHKFLRNTKRLEFKKRYISEYPEKLIWGKRKWLQKRFYIVAQGIF